MTSQVILLLYAVQALSYLGFAGYLMAKIYRNGLSHEMHLLVVTMCGVFTTQGLIQLYRLVIRAQAISAGRPTGLDSPYFAVMVALNASFMVALFVVFRRSVK